MIYQRSPYLYIFQQCALGNTDSSENTGVKFIKINNTEGLYLDTDRISTMDPIQGKDQHIIYNPDISIQALKDWIKYRFPPVSSRGQTATTDKWVESILSRTTSLFTAYVHRLWERCGHHALLTCAGFSHFFRKSSLALARNSFTVTKKKKKTDTPNAIKKVFIHVMVTS